VYARIGLVILTGIFMVPVLFVVITRFAYGKKRLEELQKNYRPEGENSVQGLLTDGNEVSNSGMLVLSGKLKLCQGFIKAIFV
jgi:hypothetical protein